MSDLKLFAAYYIDLQENLSQDEKINLLTYVKEADDYQIKHLLLKGYKVKQLSENEKVEIDEAPIGIAQGLGWRPGSYWSQDVERLGYKSGLVDAAIIAAILALGYKIYKDYISKAGKACRDYSGDKKKDCIIRFKQQALRARISGLTQAKAKCKTAKKPEKCNRKIDEEIAKLKRKLI